MSQAGVGGGGGVTQEGFIQGDSAGPDPHPFMERSAVRRLYRRPKWQIVVVVVVAAAAAAAAAAVLVPAPVLVAVAVAVAAPVPVPVTVPVPVPIPNITQGK